MSKPHHTLLLLGTLLITSLTALPAVVAEEAEEEAPRQVWILSGEVGVGPIEEDTFLHINPRLTFLQRLPSLLCTQGDCETFFEAALQVPIRLRLVDQDPPQDELLRREDWLELSDYFRVIRRLEYGSNRTPVHLRVGEIGPANLGNGTVVNGYYNVITVDHYRLGLQARVDQERWGGELMANNLVSPNLWGLRAHARPGFLFEQGDTLKSFSLGVSAVADFTAPTRLERGADELVSVGPNLNPVVAERQVTAIVGADLRWHGLGGAMWFTTPYVDVNHHIGLGTGVHVGGFVSRSFFYGAVDLTGRAEYRYLTGRYLPDYIDPLYELTRYQTPAAEPGLAGPKLRVASSLPDEQRQGYFIQLQTRLLGALDLSAAYADESGPSAANLRLRASAHFNDTARVGLFYYKFALPSESFGDLFRELMDRDGALVAAEARAGIWGPFYAHGQLGQQWRLRDDGVFDNILLWNAGVGAGVTF